MDKAKARRSPKPKVGESDALTRDAVLCSLAVYLDSLPDYDWDHLPKPLQDWNNKAIKALKTKGVIPDLPAPEKPTDPQARWLHHAKNWVAKLKVQLPIATGVDAKELSKAWTGWLLEDK